MTSESQKVMPYSHTQVLKVLSQACQKAYEASVATCAVTMANDICLPLPVSSLTPEQDEEAYYV